MASQRKAIRQAVIATLQAANTVAGTRVFANRARPLFEAELPAILVYTKDEAAEIFNVAGPEYKRNLRLSLELVVQAGADQALDDLLDDFCEAVEQAMFNDANYYGGVSSDIYLGETEMDILTEGAKPIGAAKITLMLPYYEYLPADKSGVMNSFNTMDVKIKRDGVISDPDGTEDKVTM